MARRWFLTILVLLALAGASHAQEAPPAAAPTETSEKALKPNPDAEGNFHIGDGVTPPVPLSMPDPVFSRKARKLKMSGKTLVGLTVGTNGIPQDVHVVRSMSEGLTGKEHDQALMLDQKAIEAVTLYRFRPSTFQGKPVSVQMRVEVNFTIF
jgi:protein TonB